MYAGPRAHDSPYGAAAPAPPPSSGARAQGIQQNGMRGAGGHRDASMRDSGFAEPGGPMSPSGAGATAKHSNQSAPDLLQHAFNEALRPHQEKVEMLEQQLADMQEWVREQEQQRVEIYSWIDKRGLRPGMLCVSSFVSGAILICFVDVPEPIAKQMDETADAAAALNQQLDRKITIVNFDLHRLQDDLNDSISSAHFASAMAKFLPDIRRLASLRTGPKLAYELLIKLVGNLNSHGGLEANGPDAEGLEEEIENDKLARNAFYSKMDEELVKVVRARSQDEGPEWQMQREVKRLEKNGAYLKSLGIQSYFPKAIEEMRHEYSMGGSGGGMSGGYRSGGGPTGAVGAHPGMTGTPPRYMDR